MNLTDIIPAEAFIWFNGPGYRSPLDANIDFSSVDPKDFRSDPALIQSAVVQLKQMGFQVTAIGKSSIGLRGPKALFEATFKITLKLAAAEGARQERYQVETTDGEPYLISAKDTAFEEMIAGVLLVGTNLPASTNPETMSLTDIHKVMN